MVDPSDTFTMQMAFESEALAAAPNKSPAYADLIGKPFKLGGRGPDSYDCYGLITEVAKRIGIELPNYASPETNDRISACITHMMPFWTPCEPGPGAIATIRIGRSIGHVGMVLTNERFIHAWEPAGGVCVEPIQYWLPCITGYYRFL